MTLPGFVTGQPISGQQLGNAIFQFLPALPGEGLPFMPRVLARALFPQGFQPFRVAPQVPVPVQPPAPTLIPPAAPPAPANQVPAQPPRVDARGNSIVRTEPKPAPGGYRPISSGGEPIAPARSERIRIRERPGL